jgi:hypothetical protein
LILAVRYADDTVVGFQYELEADEFLSNLKERMRKFGLEERFYAIHPR